MASHMLDEVEKVCTHVAILKFGKLISNGHVNEILKNDDIVEVGSVDLQKLTATIASMQGVKSVTAADGFVHVGFEQGTANLELVNRFCFEKNIVLSHLCLKRKSLESKFLELTNQ